jgi:hypothetical protein
MVWSFGIFSPFWFILPRKIWQPRYESLPAWGALQRSKEPQGANTQMLISQKHHFRVFNEAVP